MDLRLSGLATGMDTSAIIDQLMMIERRPVQMMQSRKAGEQNLLERMRMLNTKLAALQTAAKNLVGTSQSLSPLSAKQATSSNTALFTASADTTASTGTYSINVQQLALEQKSGGGGFNAAHAGGVLRITKDSDAASAVDVNIAAGASAEDIALAINNANATMSAAVVGGELVLTGKQTGETYTIADAGGGTLAADLGVDNTYQVAQKARIQIDGMFTVESNSNAFTTALPGVTINAVATGTASLTVTRDNTQALDKVKDFVSKFNDLVGQIQTDTKYDAKTKKGGPLTGDSFVSNLTTQLTRQLTDTFTSASDPNFANYRSVGLEITREGTLKLDEAKFTAALESNPAQVWALFGHEDTTTTTSNGQTVSLVTSDDGIAKRLDGFIDSLIKTNSKFNYATATGARYEGGMLSRLNMAEDRLDQYDDRIEAYERRLELRERTIRTQFLAMEKAVASLRNQGNYLSGQFAQMAGGQ